jgi:hypothetical protein
MLSLNIFNKSCSKYVFVWDCGNGEGLKCFSLRNTSKWSFLFFKKLFLTLPYQNNLKT